MPAARALLAAATRAAESGRAREVALPRVHEERQAEDERGEERHEAEQIPGLTASAAKDEQGHEEGERADEDVAADGGAERGQERSGAARDFRDVGSRPAVERAAGRRDEPGRSQHQEKHDRDRELAAPGGFSGGARAPSGQGFRGQAGEQRHAQRRQQVELDRIAQLPEEGHGVDELVERKRETEGEKERQQTPGREGGRAPVPEVRDGARRRRRARGARVRRRPPRCRRDFVRRRRRASSRRRRGFPDPRRSAGAATRSRVTD